MQLTRSEAHKFGGSRRTTCVFVFRDITHAYTFDGGEFHMPGFLHDGRMYSPPEQAITESIWANGEVSVWELHFLPASDTEKSHAVSEVALSVYRQETDGVNDTRFGVSVAIPASLEFMSADELHHDRWWLALMLPPEQYDKFRELLIAGQLSEVRITAEVSGYSAYYERDPNYVETNECGVAECAVTEIECRRVTREVGLSEQGDAELSPEVVRLDALVKEVSALSVMQKYIVIALGILVVAAILMVLR